VEVEIKQKEGEVK
jgi:hypothetical protein